MSDTNTIHVRIRRSLGGPNTSQTNPNRSQEKNTSHIPFKLESQPPRLTELKDKIIKFLQPSWDEKNGGVTLQPENIKVFCVSKHEAMEVGHDLQPLVLLEPADEDEIEEDDNIWTKQFHAVEFFTTVPEDLFRTMMLSQLEPATFANPKHAYSPYTNVSPLLCAGYRQQEREFPWFSTGGAGLLQVHGVSLRSWDQSETPIDTSMNPFQDDIGEDEKKGVSSMTLEQYKESVGDSYTCYDQNFGILKSNGSHNIKKGMIWSKADKIEKANKKTKSTQTSASKRTPFFRFRLKKSLDLSKYGVALVYDNSTQRHFSLVRVSESETDHNWRKHFPPEILMPADCWDKLRKVKLEELTREDLLNTGVFELEEGKEPETFVLNGVFYLPKVASLFALHDISINASAEPRPLSSGDDGDNESCKIYEGALVLYHLDLGWDIVLSIEALEKANYKVKDLDQFFCDTLMEACKQAMPNLDYAEDILGWDSEHVQDAVQTLWHSLIVDISEETEALNEKPHTQPLRPSFISGKQEESDSAKNNLPIIISDSSGETAVADPPQTPTKGQSMLEVGWVGLEEDFEETV